MAKNKKDTRHSTHTMGAMVGGAGAVIAGAFLQAYIDKSQEGVLGVKTDNPESGWNNNTYHLADVAKTVGLTPHAVINIINRYDVIQPQRKRNKNRRTETYVFTEAEVEILKRIKDYTDQSYTMNKAVQQTKEDMFYKKHIDTVSMHMAEWLQEKRNDTKWRTMLDSILLFIRQLDEQAAIVFEAHHMGLPLMECCIQAGLEGNTPKQMERAAQNKLQEVNYMLGSLLTRMIDSHAPQDNVTHEKGNSNGEK